MSRGLLFSLASNTLAAFLALAVVVGVALIAGKVLHLDETLAAAIGLGSWWVIRFFLKRRIANRAEMGKAEVGQ